MNISRLQDIKWEPKQVFFIYFSLLLSSILCSSLLFSFWVNYNVMVHTVIEFVCVFITLSTFLFVWCTYDLNKSINKMAAFGFIYAAVFDAFHMYFYRGNGLFAGRSVDLSAKYWIMGRLIEALIIFIMTFNFFKFKLNKWVTLFLSLIASGVIAFSILYFPDIVPVFMDSNGITKPRVLVECVIIYIFASSIVGILVKKLYKKRGNIIVYKYVLLALLFAIPAEICFYFSSDTQSYLLLLGHFFKTTHYLCLFLGILENVIINPYKQLEQKNLFISDILNQMPVGLMLYNKEKSLVLCNDRALKLLDCNMDEIEGRCIGELIQRFFSSKEDIESFFEHYKETKFTLMKKVIVKLKRKNRSIVRIKYDLSKLSDGQILFLFDDAGRDQELSDLQLQTQTILNSMSNAVMITDRTNKIIMLNRAFEEIIGLNSKDVLDMDLHEFRKRSQLNIEREYYEINRSDISGKSREISLIASNGDRKEMIHYSSPVFNVNGDYIGSMSTFSDITHLKKEQEKIQNQEKLALIGGMASGIIHEIKNPLSIIKGYSQLLKTKMKDETSKEYALNIENASNDIDRFVKSLLDLAKPHPSAFTELSLNALVESIGIFMKDYLASRRISMYLNISPVEMKIKGDEDKLRQVILNMVTNSVDAMVDGADGIIEVNTRYIDTSNEMILTISDTGKGMSKEQLRKIGTPFYTTKDSGTGLGLSICYQIINEHGGRIEVTSEEGKGTIFKIFLSCSDEYQVAN
ncbi:sporulation kinase E [Oxobacter pfennigii]|uniref:histidine kinase n=1 Tax=Oxobacter pfennigii TaxID=36849 RepID=A0A0P8WA43_9CLOT|nr:MASE3 domain-containing protein [Oxobacter pfennigii]KPU45478.1 sporulation kinase E [Oxobacter pfennigii]